MDPIRSLSSAPKREEPPTNTQDQRVHQVVAFGLADDSASSSSVATRRVIDITNPVYTLQELLSDPELSPEKIRRLPQESVKNIPREIIDQAPNLLRMLGQMKQQVPDDIQSRWTSLGSNPFIGDQFGIQEKIDGLYDELNYHNRSICLKALGKDQEATGAALKALGKDQEALGKDQEVTGAALKALGKDQEALGKDQEVTGAALKAQDEKLRGVEKNSEALKTLVVGLEGAARNLEDQLNASAGESGGVSSSAAPPPEVLEPNINNLPGPVGPSRRKYIFFALVIAGLASVCLHKSYTNWHNKKLPKSDEL